MHEITQLVLAIATFAILWTATIVGLVVWLEARFNKVERTIYRELNKHSTEDNERFQNQGTRIQRLEHNAFGFTHSGINQRPL